MGDFNTSLSPIYRSFRQKLNGEIIKLTDVINQMDLSTCLKNFGSALHSEVMTIFIADVCFLYALQ